MTGTRKKPTLRVEARARRWLEAAIEVLTEEGIEKVKIERLAARLGGTKGSFYYAYRDRRELLEYSAQRQGLHREGLPCSDISGAIGQKGREKIRLAFRSIRASDWAATLWIAVGAVRDPRVSDGPSGVKRGAPSAARLRGVGSPHRSGAGISEGIG